ncbi:RadC family protein [Candidatus Mesenet endosymbiont of Agriotes lineatus]|uniref:RadC family protein n=1 Tax=Candidatus Mesenet endosymbiont of Agriotes lineatus TaxID=3077948 RepID=UPI0030D52733
MLKNIDYQKGHRKRLRKKCILGKGQPLLDYEILELILYSAYQRIDVKPIARELMKRFGSFAGVFNADIDDLKNVEMVGDSAVAVILCVKEALARILKEDMKELPIVNNSQKLVNYLKVSIGQASKEKSRIIYMNKKCGVIADDLQDIGTVDQTPLYVREVIKRALAISASSIVLSHNHPSGDGHPSSGDIAITKQLNYACQSMDITLIDHIIITARDYFSFKEKGLL